MVAALLTATSQLPLDSAAVCARLAAGLFGCAHPDSPCVRYRGNFELSKQKVVELAAEVERVTAEWRGGKIVRGDDGVFRACFDPGNLYADWLSKWCDPTHYSHAGRYPYPAKPTVQQQQQQQWHLQHRTDETRRLSDDALSINQYGPDGEDDELGRPVAEPSSTADALTEGTRAAEESDRQLSTEPTDADTLGALAAAPA